MWYCVYCGLKCDRLTRDHIFPKSKGGTIIIPCCWSCNQDKGDLTIKEWVQSLARPTRRKGRRDLLIWNRKQKPKKARGRLYSQKQERIVFAGRKTKRARKNIRITPTKEMLDQEMDAYWAEARVTY